MRPGTNVSGRMVEENAFFSTASCRNTGSSSSHLGLVGRIWRRYASGPGPERQARSWRCWLVSFPIGKRRRAAGPAAPAGSARQSIAPVRKGYVRTMRVFCVGFGGVANMVVPFRTCHSERPKGAKNLRFHPILEILRRFAAQNDRWLQVYPHTTPPHKRLSLWR